jgi:hypothetical protein
VAFSRITAAVQHQGSDDMDGLRRRMNMPGTYLPKVPCKCIRTIRLPHPVRGPTQEVEKYPTYSSGSPDLQLRSCDAMERDDQVIFSQPMSPQENIV